MAATTPRPSKDTKTFQAEAAASLQNASTMKEPQLTAVLVALPERIQALSHVVDDINEFLKPKTIDAAVYNDCQYVIRVHGSTRQWTKKAMDEAAARGRLDIVRWLYLVRNEGCTTAAIDKAAVNGHLDVVKWLRAHCFRKCSDGALNTAAKNGHSEVVKWLCRSNRVGYGGRNREPYVVADGVQVAASRGDVETLSVLVRENCDWYQLGCALERAAGEGQAEVVKVLLSVELQQSCVGKALKRAVLMNRIEIVELLADQCSSVEIRAAYPAIATKCNAKITKVLCEKIRRRLTEEKWGYVTTQNNILERVKASQEVAVSNEKAVWLCRMFRTW